MLSYNRLLEMVRAGAIQGLESETQVQGSSIDVRFGHKVLREKEGSFLIVLRNRDAMNMEEVNITDSYYDLAPGEFILAHTVEKFFVPNNISATFHLKSTSARSALGHLLAVHIDPGFTNSALTLEIHNVSKYHTVRLQHNDFIGQIIMWEHEAVPDRILYSKVGHYNNDATVQGVKK